LLQKKSIDSDFKFYDYNGPKRKINLTTRSVIIKKMSNAQANEIQIDIKNGIRFDYWPLEKLVPYARNPRKNDHVVDRMVAAIKEFGMPVPICIRPDGSVVDGHLRLKAAKVIGLVEVPVAINESWTETQLKAYRLSVNQSSQWAEWDDELLAEELKDLEDADYDLMKLGFDSKELNQFMGNLEFDDSGTDDATNTSGNDNENPQQGYDQDSPEHVKMIQLFYDEEGDKNFRHNINLINTRWGDENMSVTVFKAVKFCADNLSA